MRFLLSCILTVLHCPHMKVPYLGQKLLEILSFLWFKLINALSLFKPWGGFSFVFSSPYHCPVKHLTRQISYDITWKLSRELDKSGCWTFRTEAQAREGGLSLPVRGAGLPEVLPVWPSLFMSLLSGKWGSMGFLGNTWIWGICEALGVWAAQLHSCCSPLDSKTVGKLPVVA